MPAMAAMNALVEDLRSVPDLELLQDPSELQRFSRDAYDYSPVLQPQLSFAVPTSWCDPP